MSDYEILKTAYLLASYSPDPSTQNAALLAKDGEILIWDINRFPDKIKQNEERWIKPNKYIYVEHAERNVIYKAARHGIKTDGLTMYCPWFACIECARAIIQAGIKKVIGHSHSSKNISWIEAIIQGDKLLEEAGIEIIRIKEEFGIKIRFDGNIIEV